MPAIMSPYASQTLLLPQSATSSHKLRRKSRARLRALLLLASIASLGLYWRRSPSAWSQPEQAASQQADPIQAVPQPLTELGYEADAVYDNIGSVAIHEYREELEVFLAQAFPQSDNDLADSNSLLSVLHDFLPPPFAGNEVDPQLAFPQLLLSPFRALYRGTILRWQSPSPTTLEPPPINITHPRIIPHEIYQTGSHEGSRPPVDKKKQWSSWIDKNGSFNYTYFDNAHAENFMEKRFNMSGINPVPRKGNTKAKHPSILNTYNYLASIPVMRADFWRYAIVAAQGGVYTDLDTVCLKPVSSWHRPNWQRWISEKDDKNARPAIIVGIEQDVGNRADWHLWYPRPLGLVQWTFAGTRGHPILIDVLRRVSEAINPPRHENGTDTEEGSIAQAGQELHLGIGIGRNLDSVVEKTGPGPFTDSVLRYLHAKYNTTWPALRNLPDEGLLFVDKELNIADVLVLSVTAFSPGVGNFGAGDVGHLSALAQHLFAGSWKAQYG